jgi:hypothetical protein
MSLPAALPPIIPQPFAQNAPGGNINTPIPNTTGVSGLASYDQGWPTVTMQPVVAGGIPPEGQDFNGIFFAITAHLYYLQSGQRWLFNATVAAAIGGYPVGAIVAMADGTGEWLNLTAANSVNPDTTPPGPVAAGASGWTALTSAGSAAISGLTGASPVTLTSAQGKKPILVFSGVLVGNQTVTLPNIAYEWILVNLTTGAFNLTANCGGGAAVNVPQGGYGAPLGVYAIGDGNLYPSVSPLGVPISVPAVANTLVERDGNAYVYAAYFNQSSPPNENPGGVSSVAVTLGDGFFRFATLGYFESLMLLSAIGGQVTAAQVPVGAVTQYSPQILASASLTGTPTAPTQATGTSNTTVASTAFVNPGSSLAPNGYRRNPDGSIDQWGQVNSNANAGNVAIGFNLPFPTACYAVEVTIVAPGGLGGAGSYQAFVLAAPTTTGFTWRTVSSAGPSITIMWRAIGK